MNATALLLLHIQAKGLPKPTLEFRFHETRKWKFDAAYPDRKLAIEAEGGFFGVGKPCRSCGRRKVAGHGSIQRLLTDVEKYNAAVEMGWMVLRYPPSMIESGAAIRQLVRILRGGE